MPAGIVFRGLYTTLEVHWNCHLARDGSALLDLRRRAEFESEVYAHRWKGGSSASFAHYPWIIDCNLTYIVRSRLWWRASARKLAPALTRLQISVPIGHLRGIIQTSWPDDRRISSDKGRAMRNVSSTVRDILTVKRRAGSFIVFSQAFHVWFWRMNHDGLDGHYER